MCQRSTADARLIGLRLNGSQGLRPRRRHGITVSIHRCRECGLIFPNPQPQPEQLSDHYGVPPEMYWKRNYFNIDSEHFDDQINTAKGLLHFNDGMSALDIGAGIGKTAIKLSQSGFDVWGIEPSEPFWRQAIENTGLPDSRIIQAPIESAKLPFEHFDFITFGAVLEHLYDPSGAISRALCWLKSNGVIHIEVPSSDHLIQKLIDIYYTLSFTNYTTHVSPMHNPFHIYEFTLNSFAKNGDINNYKVIEHKYDVATIYHFPSLIQPLLRSIMVATDTGMQLTVWLKKHKYKYTIHT